VSVTPYRKRAEGPYAAQVFDRAGKTLEYAFSDFPSAMEMGAILRRAHPRAVVMVVNLDEIDLGHADGLTDDERDHWEDAT
jgi:hypothetical protein